MSSNPRTLKATITVVKTGAEYNTFDDWSIAIGNNDYIGDPDIETKLVYIPGRSGYIDLSEAVAGRPIYTNREIKIKCGSTLTNRLEWDNQMSVIRNAIHGQVVQIIFDNDPNWYWQGRAEVTDFDRMRNLGTFNIVLKNALPFKYSVADSQDSWLWDPFDFEDGIIPGYSSIDVDDETLTIPVGDLPINPIIIVNSLTSADLTITWDGGSQTVTHTGTYRFPDMWLYADAEVYFEGQANITIKYRSASL